jgi:hypothetical protein
MAKAVIGIVRDGARLDACEVRLRGQERRVVQARSFSLDGAGALEGVLQELRGRGGFSAERARVLIGGDEVEHDVLTLPVMSARELEETVAREVRRREAEAGEPLEYDYLVLGEQVERGIRRSKVLLAFGPRAAIERWLGVLEAAGLRPEGLTSFPAVAIHLLRRHLAAEDSGTVCLLELGATRTNLAIFQRGVFQFHREIPLGLGEGPDDTTNGGLEGVVSEVRRSFLYFGQKFGGGPVDRILLLGAGAGDPLVADTLRRALDVPVESLSLFHEQGPLVVSGEMPARFHAAALTACCIPEREGLDLIPPAFRLRRRAPLRLAVLGAIYLLIVIGLTVGVLRLRAAAESYRASYTQAQASLERLQSTISRKQGALEQMSRYAEQVRLISNLSGGQPMLVASLWQVMAVAPPGVRFDELEFRHGEGDDWRLVLKGEVRGPDQPTVQQTFAAFYHAVRGSELFGDPEVKTLSAGRDSGRRVAQRRSEAPGSDVRLQFILEAGVRTRRQMGARR